MPFERAAREQLRSMSRNDPDRTVLEYLVEHALGRHNAKAWPEIQAHLESLGIDMSQTRFQQGLLADTRSGSIFIGSNDHPPAAGYFVIRDRADAEVAREFYLRRIAAQQINLERLNELIREEWGQS